MSHHPTTPEENAQSLRQAARSRLGAGTAPTSALPLDREALTVLHGMAGDPVGSSDALKLLQELQVHQVELDLQREELEENERGMSRELAWYKGLFALMPAACLVTTPEGRIVEANPAAASLLEIGEGEPGGQKLHDFLKPESHASWNRLLGKLEAGEQAATCDVLVGRDGGEAVTMRLSASVFPGGGVLLLTWASG